MMHFDVIVIGMGLSGLMAAKTAAETGKRVLVIGKGTGSLCLFSNTIDLLGSLPGTQTATQGLEEWIGNHPHHPYAKVGPNAIEKSLASFVSLFSAPYSFHRIGEGNAWVPTGAGTLRPTHLLPTTMIAGTSLKKGEALFVGFKEFKDFFPHYVSDVFRGRGITLPLPEALDREIAATGLSRLFERESFRERIGKEIRKELRGERHIGLPAVLGTEQPGFVKGSLEEIIGGEVFEIPTLPPSIPGKRIFHRFREWLLHEGVTFLLGHAISMATKKGKRVETVEISNPPLTQKYAADSYVLATGRFVPGGLVADDTEVVEPIFDLPVFQPQSREHWFGKSFFSDHAIHRAGILADPGLRPVNEKGELLFENLWIAGSMLAHQDLVQEKSREGIEIATGYFAAKEASGD